MERFKQTIKKIAAIAGGAVMVGATMAGALAALDSLPQPFVTTAGVFDSYIVVGTLGWNPNAAFDGVAVSGLARDVAVGIDVGAAFAQKASSAASGASSTTTVSEGKLIDAAGNPLNFGDSIFDVDSKLDKNDIDLLADGTFKDTKGTNKATTDYKQTIDFTDGTGTLLFEKDTDAADKKSTDYLKFVDTSDVWTYTYTLDFETAITMADEADIDQNKIKMLGKTYTISESDVTTNLTKMNLLSGAVTATQGEYTTQTYTMNGQTYEIEVLIISDTAPTSVKFRINGETTDALGAAETYTLADDTVIGIEEILPNEGSEAAGADQVSFYLGANKILLKPTDSNIKVNDIEVKDTDVTFTHSAATKLDKVIVSWKVDDTSDLEAGEELEDPVFGAFKFVFAGLNSVATEDLAITPDGTDKIQLDTTNKEGDTLSYDVFYANSTGCVFNGESADNPLIIGNNNVSAVGATSIESLKGIRFLYDFDNIAHLVEITDIDQDADKVWFETLDSDGRKGTELAYTDVTNTNFTFLDRDVVLMLNETAKTIKFVAINDNAGGWSQIETEKGAVISFGGIPNTDVDAGWGSINIAEVDASATVALVTANVVNCTWDSTDDEMDIGAPSGVTLYEKSTADKDNQHGRTAYGTYFDYYTKDQKDLAITYPDEEITGKVYVAPTGATTTTTATSGAVNVNYFNAATGISRTDADFATAVPTKNVILIGGPTVNELVSDLATAGKTWTSAEWATKVDTAVIKLVEDAYGTYDALIIAGYEAKDTSLAGKVVASKLLQNQFASDLTGTMATLSTAGASTVNEVTFS
ncbi:MAG: hypothetical protein PHC66_03945 [Candidatus Nanoarchaeia archaeon]|nr:hypothetical protein [Candidatus Nanoarchaeia archaeon]MDD5239378.1 hypothetical protein [Candidatus Nanoarchaeia archaeon]